jgi:Flp pilus assembly protein TadG
MSFGRRLPAFNFRAAGASLVEATIGIVLLISVVIVLVDLGILIYGVSLNDSVCRDTSQKAASGNPSDAQSRAQASIDQLNSNQAGSTFARFSLVLPVETSLSSEPKLQRDPETDQFFNPGGLIHGTVTVTTEVELRPVVIHLLIGKKSPLTFRSKQSFPISYVQPPD